MRGITKFALGSLLALSLLPPASAQSKAPTPSANAARQDTLTGKERLGHKWSDEQRIDNCNVPSDKRGAKPRPSACRRAPSS